MKLNIRLGQVSLVASIMFVGIVALTFLGVPISRFIGGLANLFGIPLYVFIFVSFIFTGYIWIKDKNRVNFRYFFYTIFSGIITVGTLFYVLYIFALTMNDFY